MKPKEVIALVGCCSDSHVLASALVKCSWVDQKVKDYVQRPYSRIGVYELAQYFLLEAVYAGWSDDDIKSLSGVVSSNGPDYFGDAMVFALTQNLRCNLVEELGFNAYARAYMIDALTGSSYTARFVYPRVQFRGREPYVTPAMLDNPGAVESAFGMIFEKTKSAAALIANVQRTANASMLAIAVKAAAKKSHEFNPDYDDGLLIRRACAKSNWAMAEELLKAGAKAQYLSISSFTKLKAALKRRKTNGLLADSEITSQHATELLKSFCCKHSAKLVALSRMDDLFKQVAELVDMGADLTQVCQPDSCMFKGLMLAAKGKGATKVEEALVVHAVTTELEG